MVLLKASLKSQLLGVFNAMKNTRMGNEDYADQLTTIITDYIKTAQVKSGIPVSTTGTAAAQSGATTGMGTLQ